MGLKDTSPPLQTCLPSINHLLVGRCSNVRAAADFLPFLSEHKLQFNGTKLMVDFSSGPFGRQRQQITLGSCWISLTWYFCESLTREICLQRQVTDRSSCRITSFPVNGETWSYTGTHLHTRVCIYALVSSRPSVVATENRDFGGLIWDWDRHRWIFYLLHTSCSPMSHKAPLPLN